MQGIENASLATLEQQITTGYGLMLSQSQLAELAGSNHLWPALQSELPRDLKRCGRKIGCRVYCPASEVVQIIIGTNGD